MEKIKLEEFVPDEKFRIRMDIPKNRLNRERTRRMIQFINRFFLIVPNVEDLLELEKEYLITAPKIFNLFLLDDEKNRELFFNCLESNNGGSVNKVNFSEFIYAFNLIRERNAEIEDEFDKIRIYNLSKNRKIFNIIPKKLFKMEVEMLLINNMRYSKYGGFVIDENIIKL